MSYRFSSLHTKSWVQKTCQKVVKSTNFWRAKPVTTLVTKKTSFWRPRKSHRQKFVKSLSKSCPFDGVLGGNLFQPGQKPVNLTAMGRLLSSLNLSKIGQKLVKWQEKPWQVEICQIEDPTQSYWLFFDNLDDPQDFVWFILDIIAHSAWLQL